jgi:hypothetical protein
METTLKRIIKLSVYAVTITAGVVLFLFGIHDKKHVVTGATLNYAHADGTPTPPTGTTGGTDSDDSDSPDGTGGGADDDDS